MKQLFLFLLLISLLLLFSCEGIYFGERTIKYEITGSTSSVDITIENEDGGTSQYSDESIPWTYTFKTGADTFVYVSAQNTLSSGSVTVSIYCNDDLFKTSTSSGAYCIATASGLVP